jgi:nucleotide-binding universal stress UspA family protein
MASKRFVSIVVALDGSGGSWCALDAALALCDEADAQLTILALESRLSPRSTVVLGARRAKYVRDTVAATALDEAEAFASYADVHVIARRAFPSSWKAVASYVLEHRHDLIVLEQRRALLRGRLLPSAADRIAARARCPVMIVRPGGEAGFRAERPS